MSNPARVKSSINPRASPTTCRDRLTTRQNFVISSHVGSSSAIDHSPLSTMHRSNASSKCCMPKSKPPHKQHFHGMSRRYMPFLKSMLDGIFRFICHTISPSYKPNLSNRRNTQGVYTSALMGGPRPTSSHTSESLFILLVKASSSPSSWTLSHKLFNLFTSSPF